MKVKHLFIISVKIERMRAHQDSDQILDTATFRIVESVEKFVFTIFCNVKFKAKY